MAVTGNAGAYWRGPGEESRSEYWHEHMDGSWEFEGYRRRGVDIQESLGPLISQLKEYDTVRAKIENGRWGGEEMRLLNHALTAPFVMLDWAGRPSRCNLVNQNAIREVLFDLESRFDHHLQVRKNLYGMPMFYLVKLRGSWHWESHGTVVEDLYRSPDYSFQDDRFVPLMVHSREKYYLRVSRFREKCLELFENDERKTDRLLVDLGVGVFEAAWDLYQQIGYLLSKSFGLTDFFSALEALYLVLSADLSELRNRATPEMELFFEKVYTDSAVPGVLARIGDMDGQMLETLAQKARFLYPHLLKAFGDYLETPVSFRKNSGGTPFYKLAFSNIHRLENAAKLLKGEKGLETAARKLEKASRWIVERLLEKKPRP